MKIRVEPVIDKHYSAFCSQMAQGGGLIATFQWYNGNKINLGDRT